ncbi:hypothetical protein JQR88_10765 [Pseudomonas luteola]|uniref:hypothetical protein n=1 Tax=Pseudomonas luteola TaxID=47886 RepID=UPI003DA04FD2
MQYDDVIKAVLANPGASYTGIGFSPAKKYVSVFEISTDAENPDPEDPDWVSILFEGGYLFSSSGEIDEYSLDDVPDEAKQIAYVETSSVKGLYGYTAEHILYRVLPEIPDPETLWTSEQKAEFIQKTQEAAKRTGLITLT